MQPTLAPPPPKINPAFPYLLLYLNCCCACFVSEPTEGVACEAAVEGAEATEATKKKKKKKKKAGGNDEDYLHPLTNPTGVLKTIETLMSPNLSAVGMYLYSVTMTTREAVYSHCLRYRKHRNT